MDSVFECMCVTRCEVSVQVSFQVSALITTSLFSVSLQFIPGRASSRRWRIPAHSVLCHCLDLTLLRRLTSVLPVPVCCHRLVVPDGGGLRVTDVAWFSGVVSGIDEQRLHREGLQVPGLKVGHEVNTEEKIDRVTWFA